MSSSPQPLCLSVIRWLWMGAATACVAVGALSMAMPAAATALKESTSVEAPTNAAPHSGRPATPPGPSRYYRCGPQGQDLRDSPCPDASPGRALDLPEDRVTPDQRQAAQQRARRDASDSNTLRRERLDFESRRPAGPSAIRDSLRAAPAGHPVTDRRPATPKDPKKRKPKDTSPAKPKDPKPSTPKNPKPTVPKQPGSPDMPHPSPKLPKPSQPPLPEL